MLNYMPPQEPRHKRLRRPLAKAISNVFESPLKHAKNTLKVNIIHD